MPLTLRFHYAGGVITVDGTAYLDDYEVTIEENTDYILPTVSRSDFEQSKWWGQYNNTAGVEYDPGSTFNTTMISFDPSVPVMDFTVHWVEFTVVFDPMGGYVEGADPSVPYTQVTFNHKLLTMPTAYKEPASDTSVYVFGWWYWGDMGSPEAAVTPDTTLLSEYKGEDGLIHLSAYWDILFFESGNICFLERTVNGETKRLILPMVKSVSDVMSASLIEKETMLFGYRNKFITDLGTKQTLTLSLERVNPPNYDDSSEDPSLFSNAKWWQYFTEFTDFWQNFGKDRDGVWTGGFRFSLIPHMEMKRDEVIRSLYPRIDKNVFIAGNISMSMAVDRMAFSLPLVVASMKSTPIIPMWSIILKDIDGTTEYTEEVTAPKGMAILLPGPSTAWAERHVNMNPPQTFEIWTTEPGGSGERYAQGTPYQYGEYETPPILYAKWKSTDSIKVFYIGSVKYGEGSSSYYVNESETANQVIERPYDKTTSVMVMLLGGGSSGSSGEGSTVMGDRNSYGGGGGGACKQYSSTSFVMNPGSVLRIKVGKGGVVDRGHFVSKGVNGEASSVTYSYGGTDFSYESEYGIAPSMTPTLDERMPGGSVNGGASAKGVPKPVTKGEDGLPLPGGWLGGYGVGGRGSDGVIMQVEGIYYRIGGSGGGGGIHENKSLRIPYIAPSEGADDVLFPDQGVFMYDIREAGNPLKSSIESSWRTLNIYSQGGDGASDVSIEENHYSDATNGLYGPGRGGKFYPLYCGGGGGGVPAYTIHVDSTHHLRGRGANGCVVIYETILEESP